MSAVQSQVVPRPAAGSPVSEFVFAGDLRQQLPLVLPLLSHLSRSGDPRWLTCIGSTLLTKTLLTKKDSGDSQLDWRRLLQVLPGARCDAIEIACRALAGGKSHTVICIATIAPTPPQLQALEQAALNGNSRCIVMRSR